jgi:hypothetical protein
VDATTTSVTLLTASTSDAGREASPLRPRTTSVLPTPPDSGSAAAQALPGQGWPAAVPQAVNPPTTPCAGCSRPIDPSRATLSSVLGVPVCPSCLANESLSSAQARSAKSLAWGAFSAASGGWLFLLMSVMFCALGHVASVACAVAAIVTGVRSLRYLASDDGRRAPSRGLLQGVTILGMVGGGLLLLAYAVGFLAVGVAALGAGVR